MSMKEWTCFFRKEINHFASILICYKSQKITATGSTLNLSNRWTQQLDGLYPCDISFGRSIVSMLLSLKCISLSMLSESNICYLVNIFKLKTAWQEKVYFNFFTITISIWIAWNVKKLVWVHLLERFSVECCAVSCSNWLLQN
jgi:hypothetical protein